MGSLVIFQRRLPRDQWGTQRVKRGRVGPRSDAGVARVDRQTVAGHVILTSFSSPSGRPKILDTNANTSPLSPWRDTARAGIVFWVRACRVSRRQARSGRSLK